MSRIATVLCALALAGVVAAPTANAAPTEAKTEVHSKCGTYVCVHTAHIGRFVRDITVESRDGLKGEMHTWWGNYDPAHQTKVRGYWEPNREQTGSNAKLVCGEMLRGGKRVEYHCVNLDQ
ncbi:hypothetical protein [Embleya scabrispora]|uniref:hypothetical protein n=1 Tax=Embleya scabrispora TaxID=159449 RepID=UPI00035F3EFE|nr:hypothetical protein [Embleya scabrispora]MYS85304.1 hypothetical protein [Streptomyces sp. SID5474]